MNHSRVMQSGYTQIRGVPGVGLHVNNEWRLLGIGRFTEYACSVISEKCLNFIT